MKVLDLSVVIQRDTETGMYVGVVPGLHGAHSQAASLDELEVNMREVVALCLEEREALEELAEREFVGVHRMAVAV